MSGREKEETTHMRVRDGKKGQPNLDMHMSGASG